MERIETVVLGAGPSGLAVAACLKRAGRPFIQVDQAPAVGWSWRHHYARLHLHTVKQHSGLPGFGFGAELPSYPSRDQVVAYLEAYAAHHQLAPRLGVRVDWARQDGDRWRIETDQGALSARFFVVAAGYNAIPHRPDFPGQADFGGRRLHASEYDSGAAFAGQRVLVVGAGNTGAEIALDLFEQGAARIHLAVRGPIHVAPRDVAGVPAQWAGMLWRRLPLAVADALAGRLARRAVGDLSAYGLRRPDYGPITQVVKHGRIPLVDVGTVALIKQGAITVVPGIDRFTATGVRFVDGQAHDYDAVVLATGYRPRLERWLEGAAALVDDRGYPRVHGAACGGGGLFFCGYANPVSGALRESGIEARRIAAAIARAA